MAKSALEQDLDFVRTLAEEGRRAPLVGGRFLVFWSGWIALVLVAHWAIVTGRAPVGREALWLMWIGHSVIAGFVHALLVATMKNKSGVSAANNRVASAVWMSLVAAMMVGWIGIAAAIFFNGAPIVLINALPALALMLYGVAHMVTASVSGGDGKIAAVIAFAFSLACFAMIAHDTLYLIAAAGAFAAGFVPGVLQLLREPSTTV
jgi:hypothetical protein